MFHIPELLDMVLSLLSIQDLARCVLVNRKWCDAAIPHLWRTIPLMKARPRKAFRRVVMKDYLQAQRHQELPWPEPDLSKSEATADQRATARHSSLSSLSKYGPWIRNLDNPQYFFDLLKPTKTMPGGKQLLPHFLKHCVEARMLTLNIDGGKHDYFYCFHKVVADSLAPNLRELYLRGLDCSSFWMSSRWFLYVISRCSFKLEKLTIHRAPLADLVGDSESVMLPIAEAELSGLKELVLKDCWGNGELSSWNWFWKSCSNVERLELRNRFSVGMHKMAARMIVYLPKVNSLVSDHTLISGCPASLISACLGGWRHIRIGDLLYRTSCKALAEHCATLEVLQATNIFEDSSSTLRQILSSSPKLRILITRDDKWHNQSWIPYLEAKDFVDEHMLSGDLNPWACELSLRVLKTKITCIPRPDVTKLLDGRQRADALKETYTREGKQLQKRIYERLSRFVNLEELCLGHGAKEITRLSPSDAAIDGEDYQYECLEMTLESGLDQLKRLKNLRVLGVRMMEQRIGLKEVQWMTQNWPKLQVIQGLRGDGDNLKAAEWLWKHSPMITVEVSSRASTTRQL